MLLVHGDEHVYEVEPAYGGVSNLTRLETYGDMATSWLRLTVDPRSVAVFSWTSQQVTVTVSSGGWLDAPRRRVRWLGPLHRAA